MALTETSIKTLTLDGDRRELLMAGVDGLYIRLRAGKGAVTKSWQWRRNDGDLQMAIHALWGIFRVLDWIDSEDIGINPDEQDDVRVSLVVGRTRTTSNMASTC